MNDDVLNDSKVLNFGTRLFYFILVIYYFFIMLYFDSYLKFSILNKNYFDILFWLFWLIIQIYLYIYVNKTNPGYISNFNFNYESNLQINISKDEEKHENRYCKICSLYQPLRSKHCKYCNRCVAKYDHHCFWVGTCIGEKNYGIFLIFWFSHIISFVNLELFILFSFKNSHKNKTQYGAFLILFLIMLCAISFVTLLFIFQLYWAITNQTTWELLRSHKISYMKNLKNNQLPFYESIYINLKKTFYPGKEIINWRIVSNKKIKNSFNIFSNKYYNCC